MLSTIRSVMSVSYSTHLTGLKSRLKHDNLMMISFHNKSVRERCILTKKVTNIATSHHLCFLCFVQCNKDKDRAGFNVWVCVCVTKANVRNQTTRL